MTATEYAALMQRLDWLPLQPGECSLCGLDKTMTEGIGRLGIKLFRIADDGSVTFDWPAIEREAASDMPMRFWCQALLTAHKQSVTAEPDVLYSASPEYRRVVDELHRTREAHGSVCAAYQNSLGDQQRAKQQVSDLATRLRAVLDSFDVTRRDDPGRGGSGGEPHR